MHLAIAIIAVLASLKWGNWRNWKEYQPTMLYMLSVTMIYEFITRDYTMWRFIPDIVTTQTTVVLLYAVVSTPLTVLMFLSNYPKRTGRVVLYYVFWIALYMAVEIVLSGMKRIVYEHNWNLWWSFLFDCVMFPMLRLHYRQPALAYLLSVFIIIAYIYVLKVPLK